MSACSCCRETGWAFGGWMGPTPSAPYPAYCGCPAGSALRRATATRRAKQVAWFAYVLDHFDRQGQDRHLGVFG